MDFISNTVFEWLQMAIGQPFLLAGILALATLITEDGALIAGSLLVGGEMASPSLIVFALTFGIIAGDISLYGLGYSARSSRFLRKRLPVKKARPVRRWLNERQTPVLFFSRFTPGTRLVTYVTFGFLKLSLTRFISVMSLAAALWVTGMVLFVSEIQQTFAKYGTWPAIGIALVCAITFIFIVPRLVKKANGNVSLHEANLEAQNAK